MSKKSCKLCEIGRAAPPHTAFSPSPTFYVDARYQNQVVIFAGRVLPTELSLAQVSFITFLFKNWQKCCRWWNWLQRLLIWDLIVAWLKTRSINVLSSHCHFCLSPTVCVFVCLSVSLCVSLSVFLSLSLSVFYLWYLLCYFSLRLTFWLCYFMPHSLTLTLSSIG